MSSRGTESTEELAIIPEKLSWTEAVTIPLSTLTAWQALFAQSGLGDFGSGGLKGKRASSLRGFGKSGHLSRAAGKNCWC